MLEHARDSSLITKELEAVGVGHAGTVNHPILGQHLIGPGIAALVVGDTVTDMPRNLFDFLPVAKSFETGNEVLGMFGGRYHVFRILDLAEVLVGGICEDQLIARIRPQGGENGIDLLRFFLCLLE